MNGIRKKRLEIGLKQKAVAKKIGVSAKTMQRYEFGRFAPDTEKLEQLAKIFNCSAEELMEEDKKDG